jgi:hypothetical protein
MHRAGKSRSWIYAALAFLIVAIGAISPDAKIQRVLAGPRPDHAQDASDEPIEETVADLAAGRVVIAVVKGAILVGTVENPIEAQTRPPVPVAMVGSRLGVILGPVDWSSPSSKQQIADLNRELPHLRGRLVADTPHLQESQGGEEATDLEGIGQGVLERLNQIVQDLHGEIDLPADQPFEELIIVDYLSGYGPEVWQLNFGLKQEEAKEEFWTTRVLRPSYLQLYPPEKKQPHTLVEFDYPPANTPPSLLDLLRQNDARLDSLRHSDPAMWQVAQRLLDGESEKIPENDAVQFMRAAMNILAPPHARETMASLTEDAGFAWILPPPAEPAPAANAQQKQRPSGAPTLVKP